MLELQQLTGYQDENSTDWREETNPIKSGISDSNGVVTFNNFNIDPSRGYMDYFCDIQHLPSHRNNWNITSSTLNVDISKVELNKNNHEYKVIKYSVKNILSKAGGRTWKVTKMHYPLWLNIDSNDFCYMDNTFIFHKDETYSQNEGNVLCSNMQSNYYTNGLGTELSPFGIRWGGSTEGFGTQLRIEYITFDSMKVYRQLDPNNWIKLSRVD